MKNIFTLLLIVALSFTVGQTTAQCTINTLNTTDGFTPAIPDTIIRGVVYSQTVQLHVPSTDGSGNSIDSILIENINGVPNGITYTINPASGIINGGHNGAVCFTGTTISSVRSYPLSFNGYVYIHFNGITSYYLTGYDLYGGNQLSLSLTVGAPTYPYGTHCDSTRSIGVSILDTTPPIPCGGGGQAILSAQITGNTAGADYSWNTGDSGTWATGISVNWGGLYEVTVTNFNGCSASATTNVTYFNVATNTVNFSLPADSSVCGGSPLTFSNLSTDTLGYSANWSIDGNGVYAHMNLITGLSQGTHTIQLVMDSGGCEFSFSQNFTVQFPGILNFGLVQSDGNHPYICQGVGSDTLSADSSYSHYLWSTGSTAANIIVHNNGNYFVTVTDLNGCTAYGEDYVYNVDSLLCGISTTSSVISKCEGAAHILGANHQGVGILFVLNYVWSNGTNSYYDTIAPLATTSYSVTITDNNGCTAKADTTITVLPNHPPVANAGSNQTLLGCGTDTLGGNPTASGGTTPYTYRWSPYNGLSSSAYPNPVVSAIYTPTTYTLIVTDSVGCTDTGRVIITPILTTPFTPPVATISGCELSCQIDSDFTYQWYHGGFPISGATVPTYSEDSSGYWHAVITSTIYPLCHVSSNYISVYPYQNQVICIVTLDSTNTYNLVVWDKTPGLGIDKFRVYKQSDSTSQYVLLGEQLYGEFSTYLDTTSKPSQASASYEISIVDSCNNESYLSSNHTTILLSSNLGINNTVNLSWNAYQGFTYSNFEIWRSANGGPMTLLTTVANSTFAYVDNSPPAQAYYQVEVTNPNGCSPSRSAFDYSTVRSNIVNNTTTAIQNLSTVGLSMDVYPNPSTGSINIKIDGQRNESAQLKVVDVLGRLVKEQSVEIKTGSNNISLDLAAVGTYFIEVVTSNSLIDKRVVVIQ